jgi:hypothetical protein
VDNVHGLTVELRPSVGVYDSPVGRGEAVHDQLEIWAGNTQTAKTYGHALVRVGMSSKSGSHINWESHAAKWPADAIAYVTSEVKRLTNYAKEPSVSIPTNQPAPQVEDLDELTDVIDLDEIED